MKTVKYQPEEVVQFALSTQDIEVSLQEIGGWLDGSSTPAPDILPVVESIMNNLSYHIRTFQAEKLFDAQVQKNAFTKVVTQPKRRAGRIVNQEDADAYGAKKITLGTVFLSQDTWEAYTSICRVLKLSRNEFAQEFLQAAIQFVINATQIDEDAVEDDFSNQGESFSITHRKRARLRKDTVTRVVRFAKDLQKGIDSTS